ncbi:MAG: phytoene/squalene synthase family protein [Hyphomonadaceae bacterium]|jgi:phytoene synthase|nr:phytoene/squalene synthase family protein [Hyphomonadaceae bacterium]
MSELLAAPFASRADHEVCRALIRHGSRSFHAASLLLPARLRDGAYALYAFCRLSDDEVDGVEGSVPDSQLTGDQSLHARIESLSHRIALIYASTPKDHPVDRALADTVRAHAIPKALFDALIDGLAWDVAGRRYETLSDVRAYAARVAGTVGAMMAALMGVREPALVARACDLGVAMQLTNIARDVGEDARMGRLYLPARWLVEAGLDPDAWLAEPHWCPQIATATERLLQAADALYARGDAGIASLPGDCQVAIAAARLIYGEIGEQVRREGLNSIDRRAIVPGGRKLALAVRALLARPAAARFDLAIRNALSLPETRFLVQAMTALVEPVPSDSALRATARLRRDPLTRVDDRVGWVMDLFADMDRRQRLASLPAPPLQS